MNYVSFEEQKNSVFIISFVLIKQLFHFVINTFSYYHYNNWLKDCFSVNLKERVLMDGAFKTLIDNYHIMI